LAACNPAGAQGAASAAASNPEYQALFKRMYANPSNLDVSFKFAEVATRLGDYEAAIGALERMLFYNPKLPRVRLELGVLYFRIGAYQMAQTYFEQALATPGAPPDVQAKVNQFLGEINNRTAAAGNGFGVFVHAGMRYQTNANAGPAGLLVRALGQDAVLNSQFAKQQDWNKFVLGGVNYNYNFGPGVLESSAFGYYAKQEHLSQFDLGLAEAQVGPRFALPQELFPGASVKVYGIGTYSILADAPYFSGPGFGASARFVLANIARLEPSYEYRSRRFKDSVLYPTASQQTGRLQTVALAGDGSFFGILPWGARLAADWNRAEDPLFEFNSYNRLAADIGFPIQFSLPLGGAAHQFLLTPSAGVSRTTYLQPNILIDPNVARLDKEWHVGVALDAQVYGNFGLRTQVQYTRTNSSLPNFNMDNFSVSFGPTARF
jgi:hypothetical protein